MDEIVLFSALGAGPSVVTFDGNGHFEEVRGGWRVEGRGVWSEGGWCTWWDGGSGGGKIKANKIMKTWKI